MLEFLFNKVADLACNFIKKRLQERFFPRPYFEEHLRIAASEGGCAKIQMPDNFHLIFDPECPITNNYNDA